MRFALSDEQRQFAESIDQLLSASDPAKANRAWAQGQHEPGMRIWQALAELGVQALIVPQQWGGIEATPVDLVVAFERLGYHAVPGPWVDTVAALPALLPEDHPLAERFLPGVASGETLASLVLRPHVPYALDADVAQARLLLDGAALRRFSPGQVLSSMDGSRRLFEPVPGAENEADTGADTGAGTVTAETEAAFDMGVLATAAQLLGAGQWLLDASVTYAKQRKQYGREIGQYQAIKHLLADVATELELARPLVHAAAIALGGDTAARDVSAAKVACARAAHLAARTGLQVHGAIGYTAEHDLGLRLTKVRALVSAWGTQAVHRTRVLRGMPEHGRVG
ncbi:hypothetical protein FHU38_003241 [Saccharomonospora amisosensis]|uniref:Acyl-CoA dehydrogenase n=1 Tax=Saccharomonospora amisosensis TaxID=1128677 RepID=A0A7X5ZRJ0_9PSEU|nr:acyl-CoA dehydrogenase family protein [Saccharomonospora amisosensis]NIJ12897.1 hypothetical protein [Saccharomonospora amisosensis]